MTAAKDKMKQRSFYMDDETYALIERHAERLGTSNGTALRMLVRHELLEEAPAPVSQRPLQPQGIDLPEDRGGLTALAAQRDRAAEGIILPPDTQETFRVPEKFREKGPRVPRPKHADDDF